VKKFLALFVLFAVLVSSIGCGGAATSPKPADPKKDEPAKDKKDKPT
jgi:hypothetical protein